MEQRTRYVIARELLTSHIDQVQEKKRKSEYKREMKLVVSGNYRMRGNIRRERAACARGTRGESEWRRLLAPEALKESWSERMYVAHCTLLLAWLARLARLGVVRGSSSSRTSLRRVGWRWRGVRDSQPGPHPDPL
jgi:hypothetical protein